MDYKAEFAKAQTDWNYKTEFSKAQSEWNSKKKENPTPNLNPSTNVAPASVSDPANSTAAATATNSNKSRQVSSKSIPPKPGTNITPGTTTAAAAPTSSSGPEEATAPASANVRAPAGSTKDSVRAAPTGSNPAPQKKPSSSTLTVVIYKPQKGRKRVGITFAEHKGQVIIQDIEKNGLAHPTELHKGMLVLNINNWVGNTAQAYQEFVEQAEEGVAPGSAIVGIVAKHPLGFIPICIQTQQTSPLQLGLSFGSATEERKKKIVVVTKIQPGSPASESPLQEGMILRAIHHKKCSPTMTPKQAYDSIYNGKHKGVVKLLASASNAYSRRAETELLDTYNKQPPASLPPNGYWVQMRHCGCKDMVLFPLEMVLAYFGIINTNRRKSVKSIYIVNGRAYNKKAKVLGEESQFVSL